MQNIVPGSLVIVDLNTSSPKVFWKGILVLDLVRIKFSNLTSKITLCISNRSKQQELHSDMSASGISIKLTR